MQLQYNIQHFQRGRLVGRGRPLVQGRLLVHLVYSGLVDYCRCDPGQLLLDAFMLHFGQGGEECLRLGCRLVVSRDGLAECLDDRAEPESCRNWHGTSSTVALNGYDNKWRE